MSPEETHNEFNVLITRHLSGELTPEETLRFKETLHQDPQKQSLLKEYLRIWESVGSTAEKGSYDLEAEWDLIKHKLPEFELPKRSPRSFLFYSYRIAAVVVLGLFMTLTGIYIARISGTEQVIAEHHPVEVLLEDGTGVIVNRQSKIRYKKQFSDFPRKVFLTGEAWFDVASDTASPFVIDAGGAMVEVLGTSFNVNAYKKNETVEVVVESGVVAVTAKQDQQEQIVLRAGNSGTYHKEKKELTLFPSSHPNKISWKTRALFFNNTPLQEVTELVNKVYNANLVIGNPELASCKITVTFRDQSLEAVLKVLEMTLDLEISRSGHEIRLNGKGCEE